MTLEQKRRDSIDTIPNPFSTGGGGMHFEVCVQALFVAIMLAKGNAPGLQIGPITKIKLQSRFAGYNTDDLIVFIGEASDNKYRKILGQIKHSIRITKRNSMFQEVIESAWKDFSNTERFEKERDILALITGPLSSTDTNDVRTILEWSRFAENSQEFFNKVELANFSNQNKREKLEAFKAGLKKANGGNPVADEVCYQFLRHFHLFICDLDTKSSVTLSLIHSLIGQKSRDKATDIWARLIEEVSNANKNAGTIILETLPEDIKEAFKQKPFTQIPKELTETRTEPEKTDWNRIPYAADLALVNLAGAWSEKNEADISILSKITSKVYSDWSSTVKEVLQLPNSPLSLQNGLWKVVKRVDLSNALAPRIFDQNLDTFKECAVTVLTERDPSFELPPEKRYAAIIHKKVTTHSQDLRRGLADGLAMIANMSDKLNRCSQLKPENTAVLAVREIFKNADWVLWGSLNNLLPSLAEAAPSEFLSTVENALRLSPCPFDELFSQERGTLTGSNYLTGLLWALEGLAWEEEYLVRVCVVLGEIASHDPGGNFANRPANSLITILLPWLPQTTAPVKKRKVAVQTLHKEFPEIVWKLIINLLPDQHKTSFGSYKPTWRKAIPDDWKESVTQKQYQEEILFYSDLAVSMAGSDVEKLNELIDFFNNLPKPSFDKLLKALSSDAVSSLPEDQRFLLWNNLKKFTSRHRRFSKAEWALNNELLSSIEAVTEKLAPTNPTKSRQRLFSNRISDLYEENGDWEEQYIKLQGHRQEAVEEILKLGGIESVIQFAEAVESSGQVGHFLGKVSNVDIDAVLLPAYLVPENHKLSSFTSAYVWSRHYTNDWSWVDHLDKAGWSSEQVGQFLSCLPFTKETWGRVAKCLGNEEKIYWLKTNASPYETNGELGFAIDKLIEYGRPYAAINCLYGMHHKKRPINVSQCVKALLATPSSLESYDSMNAYPIVELIKFLQTSSDVSQDELFHVEWAFLPLLDDYHGARPKSLENRLASDPEFFCEVIQLMYRSKKTGVAQNKQYRNSQVIATKAWQLLYKWSIPPGMHEDGSFDDAQFSSWLQRVKEICRESGHLEVALIDAGKVLICCPPDKNGLWINCTVATALNARDAEYLRDGFCTGTLNSRGVYSIDPTGKPELELAEQFRKKAEEVENAGYQRFAVSLRNLSESYIQEAKWIVAEHKK
ncbi:MAG: hypothetical protein OXI02_00680 [Candidatus Dadabacteria bacterium]|nr:hypothetical protein [Candidatus Dadabacteria bacterium]MDE0291204.1 hypothetical protein [Candidatus Dadabacteria bacterium]MDE0476565.1 hypothetical protein [Candidatus Dadabacteria bacterium]